MIQLNIREACKKHKDDLDSHAIYTLKAIYSSNVKS